MSEWRNQLRRGLATALLVPVLVMASSFAHDLMRCRLTGAVVPTCVCPTDAGASAPAAATLADPDCCERQSIESIAVACERSTDGAATLPRPVASAAAPHLVPPLLDPSAATWRWAARRPPGLRAGVSLVLLKRSLLI